MAYGLSPVKILVLTFILLKLTNVSLTPFLAGSRKATKPIKVSSCSNEILNLSLPG